MGCKGNIRIAKGPQADQFHFAGAKLHTPFLLQLLAHADRHIFLRRHSEKIHLPTQLGCYLRHS